MIPEWCKRAVEEIRKHSVDILEGRCPDAGYMAAIVAKHAPLAASEVVAPNIHNYPMLAVLKLAGERQAQVRELVEAARNQYLYSDDRFCLAQARSRLRRALEPFKEVS